MLTVIIFQLLFVLVRLLTWAIIIAAVISLLISFGVLDTRNRAVWTISDILFRITDPILRPIRQVLPQFGGIDFSPWVALIVLQIVVTPLLDYLFQGIHFGVWTSLI